MRCTALEIGPIENAFCISGGVLVRSRCSAVQEFLEVENGPLLKARRFISYQIEKRIRVLKASTGNSDADISHLSDNEYVELMTKHSDNLEKHIHMQLVQSGKFKKNSAASKMHQHLKLELLLHSHTHTDVLLKVVKAAGAANRQWRTSCGMHLVPPATHYNVLKMLWQATLQRSIHIATIAFFV